MTIQKDIFGILRGDSRQNPEYDSTQCNGVMSQF